MRYYGILASKNKTKDLNIAKKDLGQAPWKKVKIDWKTIALEKLKIDVDKCSKCKVGIMEVVQVILPVRGPPIFACKSNKNYWENA